MIKAIMKNNQRVIYNYICVESYFNSGNILYYSIAIDNREFILQINIFLEYGLHGLPLLPAPHGFLRNFSTLTKNLWLSKTMRRGGLLQIVLSDHNLRALERLKRKRQTSRGCNNRIDRCCADQYTYTRFKSLWNTILNVTWRNMLLFRTSEGNYS